MMKDPISINTIIRSLGSLENAQTHLLQEHGLHLIVRKRVDASVYGYVRYRPLVERASDAADDRAYVCDAAHGFYIVDPDVSAIFISPDGDANDGVSLLLILIMFILYTLSTQNTALNLSLSAEFL